MWRLPQVHIFEVFELFQRYFNSMILEIVSQLSLSSVQYFWFSKLISFKHNNNSLNTPWPTFTPSKPRPPRYTDHSPLMCDSTQCIIDNILWFWYDDCGLMHLANSRLVQPYYLFLLGGVWGWRSKEGMFGWFEWAFPITVCLSLNFRFFTSSLEPMGQI